MVMISYPGVRVRKVPSCVRSMTGVSTSIAMFSGRTGQDPLNTPKRYFELYKIQECLFRGSVGRGVELATNGIAGLYPWTIVEMIL